MSNIYMLLVEIKFKSISPHWSTNILSFYDRIDHSARCRTFLTSNTFQSIKTKIKTRIKQFLLNKQLLNLRVNVFENIMQPFM